MRRFTQALVTCAILAAGCSDRGEDGRLRASGTFEADKIKIVAPAPGRLESFSVDEGDRVELDQVIAVIDSEDLELKKQEALAGLDLARAQLKLVEKGVRLEDLKQLKAVRKEVTLQKSLADKNLERLEQLHESGTISTSALDEAQTKRDVVGSKLSQLKWQLKKAKTGAQEEEIDMARAAVAQIEAGLKQLDKLIEDRTITSPVKGTVLSTYAHEGEYTAPGQLLATVTDLEELELIAYVSEKDLARVRLGQEVSVHIDAFADRWFEGTVTKIADEAEFTPSTVQTEEERVKLVFEVTVSVRNPEGFFKPGLPADVVFEEAARK
jgi:HlyD family secretion protein